MNVSELRRNQRAVVRRVTGGGTLSTRLMELGFTPGTALTLSGAAPGGDPLLVRLRGFTLSISRREAERIEVTEESL